MAKKTKSNNGSAFATPDGLLDDINRRLLAELHADPRIAMSALARRVKMSAPAVTERVQRLERAGVITGYRLEVDPAALGLPVTAFARIRPAAGQLSKVADLARSLPQITECHRITGEDCFLVKVHASAVEQLENGSRPVPRPRTDHHQHRREHTRATTPLTGRLLG